MATLPQVYADISAEREYQKRKYAGEHNDDDWSYRDWVYFILDYLQGPRGAVHNERTRLVKVAALAVAAVEAIDRKAAVGK